MTIAASDSGSTVSGTTVATSGLLNVAVGDFVAIVVSADNGPKTVTGITDNSPGGNTWTPDASNPQAITGMNTYVFTSVITSPKTGFIVTAAMSGTTAAAISAVQVIGRSASPILVRVPNIEGARTASHTSAATGILSQSGCDIICMVADTAFFDSGSNQTYTPGGSFVLPTAGNVNTAGSTPTSYILYVNNVGTGSQTATWTNSPGTTQAASVILALAPAAGGTVIAWVV